MKIKQTSENISKRVPFLKQKSLKSDSRIPKKSVLFDSLKAL